MPSSPLENGRRGRSAATHVFTRQPYGHPIKLTTHSNFRAALAAQLVRLQARERWDREYRAEVTFNNVVLAQEVDLISQILPGDSCAPLHLLRSGSPAEDPDRELTPTEPASSPGRQLTPIEPGSSTSDDAAVRTPSPTVTEIYETEAARRHEEEITAAQVQHTFPPRLVTYSRRDRKRGAAERASQPTQSTTSLSSAGGSTSSSGSTAPLNSWPHVPVKRRSARLSRQGRHSSTQTSRRREDDPQEMVDAMELQVVLPQPG